MNFGVLLTDKTGNKKYKKGAKNTTKKTRKCNKTTFVQKHPTTWPGINDDV